MSLKQEVHIRRKRKSADSEEKLCSYTSGTSIVTTLVGTVTALTGTASGVTIT